MLVYQACLARELTKIHEENVRGTLAEVIQYFSQKDVKGEIVIIVGSGELRTES